jgi:hypoxanthine phosphoribosyltransferase
MALDLTDHFDGEDPLFVSLLFGALPFAAGLMRSIARQRPHFHPQMDNMIVTRYGDSREGRQLRIVTDLSPKTKATGRPVVILDDIADTNETVNKTADHLTEFHGASLVNVAVLVDRDTPNKNGRGPDFVGFTFKGDDWLTGMGLDDAELAPEGNRWAGYIALANSVQKNET